MFIWKLIRPLFLFSPGDGDGAGGGGSAGDGTGDGGAGNKGGTGDAGGSGSAGDSKTFTQADIDKIVSERLSRESKKLRREIEDSVKADADKAKLDEVERLKLDIQERDKKITDTEAKATARAIAAQAKVEAVGLGVKPERVEATLKLADLSGVTLGDDGEPNAAEIKKAIEAMLADYPEFKAEAGGNAGGGDFSGGAGSGSDLTWEKIADMTPAEYGKRAKEIEAWVARNRKT